MDLPYVVQRPIHGLVHHRRQAVLLRSSGHALFGQGSIGGVTDYVDENQGSVSATPGSSLAERDKYLGAASAVYDHYTTATRGWQKIDGAWYYFIPSTGYMVRDGWQWIYEPTLGRSSWNYCKHNGQCIDQLYTENGMTFMSLAGPKDYAGAGTPSTGTPDTSAPRPAPPWPPGSRRSTGTGTTAPDDRDEVLRLAVHQLDVALPRPEHRNLEAGRHLLHR